MPGKTRVSTLAKELGVTAKDVLAKLQEMGEFVKSASSPIESPVARQVREAFYNPSEHRPNPRQAQRSGYPKNPYGLSAPATEEGCPREIADHGPRSPVQHSMASRPPPRKWHKGTAPTGLNMIVLDRVIVPNRPPFVSAPMAPYRYFEDEIKQAQQYAAEWSGALFEGMDLEDIGEWMRCSDTPMRAEQAIALYNADVQPDDLCWSYEDRGRPTLGDRLVWGNITVEQVILEVERRRVA